ncbi:MAG: DUF5681 domain-containing protein [Rhodoplanes sp.]
MQVPPTRQAPPRPRMGTLMSDTHDNAGGYKRPPEGSRFRRGQSGNPRGRPKGARNLMTDLTALMKKRVAVREDGELRRVSRQEAMLLSLFEKAVRGDVKASGQIIATLMKMDAHAAPSKPDIITDKDLTIVGDFLRRNLSHLSES